MRLCCRRITSSAQLHGRSERERLLPPMPALPAQPAQPQPPLWPDWASTAGRSGREMPAAMAARSAQRGRQRGARMRAGAGVAPAPKTRSCILHSHTHTRACNHRQAHRVIAIAPLLHTGICGKPWLPPACLLLHLQYCKPSCGISHRARSRQAAARNVGDRAPPPHSHTPTRTRNLLAALAAYAAGPAGVLTHTHTHTTDWRTPERAATAGRRARQVEGHRGKAGGHGVYKPAPPRRTRQR